MRKPRSNVPFKYIKQAYDVTLCENKYCSIRFTCLRHMLYPNSDWQSYAYFDEGEKGCRHHLPYYVWTDAQGNKYLLKGIDNPYLLNIIKHLKERLHFINECLRKDQNTNKESPKILKDDKKQTEKLLNEFKKEAVKRKLIKKTVQKKKRKLK